MKKTKLLPLLGILLVSGCLTTDSKVVIPLYEDPTGWQIRVGHSGERIVSPYLRAKEIATERGYAVPSVEGMDYLCSEPWSFYGFSVIPNGVLIWEEDATITLWYVSGEDTLSTVSTETFFCHEQYIGSTPLPGQLIYGPVDVPNSYYRIFGTGNGNPIVFGRFPLGKEPDAIVRCTVANVRQLKGE